MSILREMFFCSSDDERGASLVEYSLLMAMVALACIAAVRFFGTATGGLLSSAVDSLPG